MIEQELLCALADENEEHNEVDDACDAKRTYCAGLAINATIVCASN